MKVTCEKCGATLTAPDNAVGKTVRCPKCKQTFKLDVVELTEEAGQTPAVTSAPALGQSPPPVQQGSSSIPAPPRQATAQPQTPVLTTPQRRCIQCGFQGYMPKKWDSWVVPVAIIVGIFTMGLGLLILLVPKKHHCPQCGANFE